MYKVYNVGTCVCSILTGRICVHKAGLGRIVKSCARISKAYIATAHARRPTERLFSVAELEGLDALTALRAGGLLAEIEHSGTRCLKGGTL